MFVENAIITLTAGEPADVAEALARVSDYLERSSHCAEHLLTRDLAPGTRYLLSTAWDAPRWRALAWRYFADVFASAGVAYRVSLVAREQVPEEAQVRGALERA